MALDLKAEITREIRREISQYEATLASHAGSKPGDPYHSINVQDPTRALEHARAKLAAVQSGAEAFDRIVRIAVRLYQIAWKSDGSPFDGRDPTMRRVFLDKAATAYVVVNESTT